MSEELVRGSGVVLEFAESDRLATVRLDRPERRNALDREQWELLAAALAEARTRPGLRALVLTGGDEVFASGGDISRFLDEVVSDEDARSFRRRLAAVFDGLASFPVPTVARIAGAAIGGGLELALACDIRIARDDATFGMPAVRFGLTMAIPELRRLVDAVGVGGARWLALTGRVVDSQEALRLGLVHAVHPASEFDRAVNSITTDLATASTDAVGWFRAAITALSNGNESEIQRLRAFEVECLVSADFRGRVTTFLTERAARRAART